MMPRFGPHPDVRPSVVTGASSGIGKATAEELAVLGHPVVLGARRVAECEETARAIRERGGKAWAFHLDLSDPHAIEQFVENAVDALGKVEILVSNAGNSQPGSALDIDPGAFDLMLAVNVVGTYRLARALLPAMLDRRRGDAIFITSDVVGRPRPLVAGYVTSKWGLEGFVRSLQMELEGTGVRATIVRPGPTMTEMGMDWGPEVTTEVLQRWTSWGFARHSSFMRPSGVAKAITAAASLPRGVHLTVLEIQPEAPIVDRTLARTAGGQPGEGTDPNEGEVA